MTRNAGEREGPLALALRDMSGGPELDYGDGGANHYLLASQKL